MSADWTPPAEAVEAAVRRVVITGARDTEQIIRAALTAAYPAIVAEYAAEIERLTETVAALRSVGATQYKAVQDIAGLAHVAQDEVAEHEAVYGQMLDNVGKARRERDLVVKAVRDWVWVNSRTTTEKDWAGLGSILDDVPAYADGVVHRLTDQRDEALRKLAAVAALADRACICDECEAYRGDLRAALADHAEAS